MSRIGRMPIKLPQGVTAAVKDGKVTVTGPLGTLSETINPAVSIAVDQGIIHVTRNSEEKKVKALHGLMRALVNNMVTGVTKGFKKSLVVTGVGYKCALSGNKLTLNIGFSHPIEYVAPAGIKLELTQPLEIAVSGADKHAVGQAAANIKALKPIEPYHGYGIRYKDEAVVLKVGKKAGK